jgi:hypothetical protein
MKEERELFEKAELEVICFEEEDIVTTSCTSDNLMPGIKI